MGKKIECIPMLANETFRISGKRLAELKNAEHDLMRAKSLIRRQRLMIQQSRVEKREQISISQKMKQEYLQKGDKVRAYVVTLLRKRLFLA